MSIRRRNPEDATAPLVFYHGAQRWEGPPSIVAHRKGHAEHGAGIYLTTSWERAASYAKGGGSVYRFEVSPDMRWLEDARLPAAETVRWVKSLPRLKGKADIVASLERTAGRVGPSIPAEGLVAAFVNFGASAGQHGPSLAEYLVAHGIDASHVQPTVNEDWVVVFNPAKVLRVTRLAAKDTGEGFAYDLPRVRRNPEDGPVRIRLVSFGATRKPSPEVEAFLRDLYEASYPNAFSNDPSSRILASAHVRVEVTPMYGGIRIDELEAGSRGQGEGTKALRFLTGLADKHGVSLFLQAHPFGDEHMSLEALERFYRRHGFRPDDEEDNTDEVTHMHRWPREVLRANPTRQNPARKAKPTSVTDTPAFRRWFGQSKVVDARGEPLAVYHGTESGGFDTFRASKVHVGFFFSDSPRVAWTYSRLGTRRKVLTRRHLRTMKVADEIPALYKVYLQMERPLVVDAAGDDWSSISVHRLPADLRDPVRKALNDAHASTLSTNELLEAASLLGFDGIIVKRVWDLAGDNRRGAELSTTYAVSDPTQVKSVNMNVGTFDPADPSILRNPSSTSPASSATRSAAEGAAFRRWFGRSKVVDARGKPLVVYHGAARSGFDVFRKQARRGIFFSDIPEVAWTYTHSDTDALATRTATDRRKGKPALYEVYLRMENPLVVDARGSDWASVPVYGMPEAQREAVLNAVYPYASALSTDDLVAAARKLKYDGVIIRNVVDIGDYTDYDGTSTIYAVFEPTQVKSANMNAGTFDPADRSILRNPARKVTR